jgi:riboflavin kinase/FMN adenylyltransferase
MLGRPVSLVGTVVHGDALGRTLGYPTANLNLEFELRPPRGVYGAEVWVESERYFGLVNIGVRPTIHSTPTHSAPQPSTSVDSGDRVEVHLLGFHGDLYGRTLEVCFLHRIRDEMRFAGIPELRAQIARDEASFTEWLKGCRDLSDA